MINTAGDYTRYMGRFAVTLLGVPLITRLTDRVGTYLIAMRIYILGSVTAHCLFFLMLRFVQPAIQTAQVLSHPDRCISASLGTTRRYIGLMEMRVHEILTGYARFQIHLGAPMCRIQTLYNICRKCASILLFRIR